MKIREVCELLNAQVVARPDMLDEELESAFGSDLMSDVIASAHGKMLLLTGLNSPQLIRTAEITEIPVIVFVKGRCPSQEVIDMTKDRKICLLRTDMVMYEACGRLYQAGLAPCKN